MTEREREAERRVREGRAARPSGGVPLRALVLSALALSIPLGVTWMLPARLSDQVGLLPWLSALIPAFLLSYYRGWTGSALALAGGMAALALSNLFLAMRDLPLPSVGTQFSMVAAFLAFGVGLGWVTELLHRERRVAREQALSDALTGLPNRRHADVFLDAAIGTARLSGEPLSVVSLDLDYFKRLNDTHGHGAGDQVLRAFADLLRVHAVPGGTCARIGGEEFLVVLPGVGHDGARALADAIRQDLSKLDLRWQPLTVSAGVASFGPGRETRPALMQTVDAALYRAKELGRDRVESALDVVLAPAHESAADAVADAGELAPGSPRGIVAVTGLAARQGIRRVLELNGLRVEEYADAAAVPLQIGAARGTVALVVASVGPRDSPAAAAVALVRAVGETAPVVLFTGAVEPTDREGAPDCVTFVDGTASVERLHPLLARLLASPVVRNADTMSRAPSPGGGSHLIEPGALLTRGRILVVDDERSNRVALRRTLETLGFNEVTVVASGEEALTAVAEVSPDLLVLDLHMPGMDGFAVMEAIRPHVEADGYLPILVVTGDKQWELRQRALRMGAKDFLNKPFDVSELGARVLNLLETRQLHLQMQDINRMLEVRVAERTQQLDRAKDEILFRLARAAEYRDDVTGQHAARVGKCSRVIAEALGLPPSRCEMLERTAPLHDIGKIAVPDAILLKPTALTPEERKIMETHTTVGADLLSESSSEVMEDARVIALTHHERWDGRGYPQRLFGEDIPVSGRIVALADALDALTHVRPYKSAFAFDDAVGRLRTEAGTAFDPAVVATMDQVQDAIREALSPDAG